jgi:histidinol-phosphate aminotransferase
MPDTILEFAHPGVCALQPYQPGKPVSELEREYGISDALKLASNESPIGPSPMALKAAKKSLKEMERYPDGNGFALKEALAVRHNVSPDQITLGNGSNELLELIARVFLSPGTNAVFSQHAFAVYPLVTQAVGADARVALANPSSHVMPYGHDLSALRGKINEATRVVFIANPNNPTGTWLAKSELEAFIQDIPSSIVVVIDEAYFEYVQEDEYPDTTRWVEKYSNLMVTRTFSKAFGLAGLRVGYSVTQSTLADLLNRVRQPFNVNAVAQAAALAALDDHEHIDQSVKINFSGLRQLSKAFEQEGWAYIPSVANFICVDVGRPGSEVYEALLHEGIIVRPIENYGLPNYLRLTVGRKDENDRMLQSMKKVLA